jgi:hypothetical protein
MKKKCGTSKAETDSCMTNRAVALSLAVLGAALFVPPAQAQRQFAVAPSSAGRNGPAFSRHGGMAPPFVRPRHARRRYADYGFAPYFYSDDDYYSEPPVIEVPPTQFIQQTAPAPEAPAPVRNPPDSLVLELQGDHWVRVTNYGQSQTDGQSLKSGLGETISRPTLATESPAEIPPAILVFRDGHREEIGKYTVVGTTLYASADYWRSGSWTRKVQLSELDVPATLQLNQQRDAKFSLPSGPGEIMIRP